MKKINFGTHKSKPETEKMFVPFEVKSVTKDAEGNHVVEGYANVFHVLDSHGDRMQPGAFTKTVGERVPKGLVKFFDSHLWDSAHTLGTVTNAVEDKHGLYIKAVLSNASSVRDTLTKIKEGHLDRMSIGYISVRESWDKDEDGDLIRKIHEVKLFEVSIVPIAANESSTVTYVKSAVPYQDLPLYGDKMIDLDKGGDAETRVKTWANGNVAKEKQAYLRFENPNKKGLLIADVKNGKLVAVPEKIVWAGFVLTDTAGFDEKELTSLREKLEPYFKRMELTTPWQLKEDQISATKSLATKGEEKDTEEAEEKTGAAEPLVSDSDAEALTAEWDFLEAEIRSI